MPRNDAAAPGHVCPGIRIHVIDIVQPPGMGIPPIADMDAHRAIVAAVLATKRNAEAPQNARSQSHASGDRQPLPLRHDHHDFPQPWSYSSWRRHQAVVSLRPSGARSSHWYMPQRPSGPRA